MGHDLQDDATLTSAFLDRLLHHAETVRIEGKSFRMKDQINEPTDAPLPDPTKEETAHESTD